MNLSLIYKTSGRLKLSAEQVDMNAVKNKSFSISLLDFWTGSEVGKKTKQSIQTQRTPKTVKKPQLTFMLFILFRLMVLL